MYEMARPKGLVQPSIFICLTCPTQPKHLLEFLAEFGEMSNPLCKYFFKLRNAAQAVQSFKAKQMAKILVVENFKSDTRWVEKGTQIQRATAWCLTL